MKKRTLAIIAKKNGKIRFAKMMNDILMGENNFYTYKWY